MTSAAAQRAALAAIGRDLAAVAGNRGARRVAALLRPSRGDPLPSFADLAAAPAWLRMGRDAQTRLARGAALVALAPSLAVSIDGAWLGEIARLVGDDRLDRAIAASGAVPDGGVAAVSPDAFDALGFDLLREVLPDRLSTYLDWAPAQGIRRSTALAQHCLTTAQTLLDGA